MMITFYIIMSYLITWGIMVLAIKLDNVKNIWCDSEGKSKGGDDRNYIMYDLRIGHWWWLIFPGVNIIASIVFLIMGICSFISEKVTKESAEVFLRFIFKSHKKYK